LLKIKINFFNQFTSEKLNLHELEKRQILLLFKTHLYMDKNKMETFGRLKRTKIRMCFSRNTSALAGNHFSIWWGWHQAYQNDTGFRHTIG